MTMERQVTTKCGKTGMGTAQNQMGGSGQGRAGRDRLGGAKESTEVEVEDGGVSWRNWNGQAAG